MRKIVVFTNLTLDGVMQAPGRPDEDRRGGFEHGGWGAPYQAMSSGEATSGLGEVGALLFGRRTYEDFYDFWPKQTDGNPFTDMLNNMPKYVASRTLREPLPWMNSHLLHGEVPQAVLALKGEPGPNLMVMGSGVLVQTLMEHNLVDRYVLLIHPLVLGQGRRLFPEGGVYSALELAEIKTTPSGVIAATYKPTEYQPPAEESM